VEEAKFDSLIHAPNRLMLCALLVSVAELEFAVLREKLEVSDSVLSKQIKALSDAGYLDFKKINKDGRPRTWLSLNEQGIAAYNAHVRALKDIVG
jgi:DNA-binding MarR family transcriptional regulator